MALQNIEIDFEVLKTGNPRTLLICDTSTWAHIENSTSIIEICLPTGKTITHYFSKNNNNIYNSSNLYLSAIEERKYLPDGLYRITVKGSPDSFNKTVNHIRTEKLQLDIDTLYISQGSTYSEIPEDVKDVYNSINFMIKASESAVRLNESKKAISYYNEAKTIYENYKKC